MKRYTDQSESYRGEAVKRLAIELLKSKVVTSVFIPYRTEYSKIPMPSLISDHEKMDGIDPLAPCAPFNSAKQAAAVLKNSGKKTALFLRPCEVRALTELVKLNQCSMENAVIISFDCFGRMENDTYIKLSGDKESITDLFHSDEELQKNITSTCRSCTDFTPQNADIGVNLMGTQTSVFSCLTAEGEEIISQISGVGSALSLTSSGDIDETQVKGIKENRAKAKEELFLQNSTAISDMESFQRMIGACLNCYNCRTACPVCYCKECVFLTDVFLHDSDILHQRSMKRGVLKLPADTTMFHMTRISHIAHSCVGCGQCTSVCPSNIEVADIFRTVSEKTQEKLGYKAGSDPTQPIPYLAYKEEKNNG